MLRWLWLRTGGRAHGQGGCTLAMLQISRNCLFQHSHSFEGLGYGIGVDAALNLASHTSSRAAGGGCQRASLRDSRVDERSASVRGRSIAVSGL